MWVECVECKGTGIITCTNTCLDCGTCLECGGTGKVFFPETYDYEDE